MRRILIAFICIASTAVYAAENKNCCPAPTNQLAQAQLPSGHPPIGGGSSAMKLPPGHPPMTQPATTQPGATSATIAVRAIAGTEGMAVPAGAPVKLNLIHGNQIINTLETALDKHGIIVFENVAVAGPVTPQVIVTYKGVEYVGMSKPMHGGQTQVDVTVYELTDKKPAWTVAMRHLMVSPAAHGVIVSDVYVIDNPTDRTYIGDDHATFLLPLPNGAKDVNPSRGFDRDKTHLHDGELVTATPLIAGKSQFALVYELPAVAGKVTLPLGMPAPTQNVKVFLPVTDANVTVTGLTDEGVKEMGSTRVRVLSGAELKSAATATITIDGFTDAPASQPAPGSVPGSASTSGAASPSSAPQVVAGVGVLGAFIAGIVIMLIRKPQKKA